MFFYFMKIIVIILCIYGLLSLLNELCIPKMKCNMECILYVKNIENEIEYYLRMVKYLKIDFEKIIIIDMNSTDNTFELLKGCEGRFDNVCILNYDEDILQKNN